MKVWLVVDPCDEGHLYGVYATEELAKEVARREAGHLTSIAVWDEEVVTELPPAPQARPTYQVIP